jgi:hypothetical protein
LRWPVSARQHANQYFTGQASLTSCLPRFSPCNGLSNAAFFFVFCGQQLVRESASQKNHEALVLQLLR